MFCYFNWFQTYVKIIHFSIQKFIQDSLDGGDWAPKRANDQNWDE
jgi:hypothetical protein